MLDPQSRGRARPPQRLFNKEEVETQYATNSKRGPPVFTTEQGFIKFESNLYSKEDGLQVKRVRPNLVVSAPIPPC
jgi:hypothetical protein